MHAQRTRAGRIATLAAWLAMGTLSAPWSLASVITFQEDVSPSAGYQSLVVDVRSGSNINVSRENSGSVFVGRIDGGGTDDAHGLFGFDISSIPAGSTITSVTLTLYSQRNDDTSANQDFTMTLHPLVGAFIEGVPGTEGAVGVSGPSWNRRDIADPPVSWTTPGGDYGATVLSSLTANPKTLGTNVQYVLPSTTEFVAAAQGALDGGTPLFMLTRATSEDTSLRGLFRFLSDDNTAGTQYNPALTIEYVPEPTCLLLLAAGSVVSWSRRRRIAA